VERIERSNVGAVNVKSGVFALIGVEHAKNGDSHSLTRSIRRKGIRICRRSAFEERGFVFIGALHAKSGDSCS